MTGQNISSSVKVGLFDYENIDWGYLNGFLSGRLAKVRCIAKK